MVQKQASRAEEIAEKKVKFMEENLKTQTDRQTDAPDQGVVKELREASM